MYQETHRNSLGLRGRRHCGSSPHGHLASGNRDFALLRPRFRAFCFWKMSMLLRQGISYPEGQGADPLSQDSAWRRGQDSCPPRPQSRARPGRAPRAAARSGAPWGLGAPPAPLPVGRAGVSFCHPPPTHRAQDTSRPAWTADLTRVARRAPSAAPAPPPAPPPRGSAEGRAPTRPQPLTAPSPLTAGFLLKNTEPVLWNPGLIFVSHCSNATAVHAGEGKSSPAGGRDRDTDRQSFRKARQTGTLRQTPGVSTRCSQSPLRLPRSSCVRPWRTQGSLFNCRVRVCARVRVRPSREVSASVAAVYQVPCTVVSVAHVGRVLSVHQALPSTPDIDSLHLHSL